MTELGVPDRGVLARFCAKCNHYDCYFENGCPEYQQLMKQLDEQQKRETKAPAHGFGKPSRLYDYRGERLTLTELAARVGISYQKLREWLIRADYDVELAVSGEFAQKVNRYEYHDQQLTAKELSELEDVSYASLRKRLRIDNGDAAAAVAYCKAHKLRREKA